MTDPRPYKMWVREYNSYDILAAIVAQGGVDTSGIPGDTPPANRNLTGGVAQATDPGNTAAGKIVEIYYDQKGKQFVRLAELEAALAGIGDSIAASIVQAGFEARTTPITAATNGEAITPKTDEYGYTKIQGLDETTGTLGVTESAPATAADFSATLLDAVTGETTGTAVAATYTEQTAFVHVTAYTSGTITVRIELSSDGTLWDTVWTDDYTATGSNSYAIPYGYKMRAVADYTTGTGVGTVTSKVVSKGA